VAPAERKTQIQEELRAKRKNPALYGGDHELFQAPSETDSSGS
jgi:hypothetical protein